MSLRTILSIGALLTLLFAAVDSLPKKYRKPKLPADPDAIVDTDFDYYVLAQVVPQVQCYKVNNLWKAENSSCSPCASSWARNDLDWTVHGLWPSNLYSDRFLGNCNRTARFDGEQLDAALRAQLEYHWTDLKRAAYRDDFWRHEWEKHGTCAMRVDALSGMRNYFQRTIELLKRFNVGHHLEKQGVMPGNHYDFDEFNDAIVKAYGARAKIKCAKSPTTGKQYVNEVHLCMDRSFEMIDCTGVLAGSCSKKKKLTYAKNANQCTNKTVINE
ncbi:hypothetical protein TKK_0000665 [Trichogramma kaykai]|uniref:Uncharacterized protein n=1 Tax=Trichogramma kaykai TaxID=54128 RepID=A0ABD2W0B2_9HYME